MVIWLCIQTLVLNELSFGAYIIANISQPIIELDFLSFYCLLSNVRKRKLVDAETVLAMTESQNRQDTTFIKIVIGKSIS